MTMATTELQQQFEAAADCVSSGSVGDVSQQDQLELYGLFSLIRKGSAPKQCPSMLLDPVGHAKWTAWNKVNDLPKEEGMMRYIELAADLASTAGEDKGKKEESEGFGVRHSTGFDVEMDGKDGSEGKKDVGYYAALGEAEQVLKLVKEQGVSANYRDEENLTGLMRAADRNQCLIVDILVAAGADVNATDDEGQTALHYAAICEHEEMAGLLVTYGAEMELKDNDGTSAMECASGATKQAMVEALKGTWKRSSKMYDESWWGKLGMTCSSYMGIGVGLLSVSVLIMVVVHIRRGMEVWKR